MPNPKPKVSPHHERVELPSGFPLYVTWRRLPAEPDVGIMEPYYLIENVVVRDKTGRVKWFWRALTSAEERHIVDQL